jgi:hypothetical protein
MINQSVLFILLLQMFQVLTNKWIKYVITELQAHMNPFIENVINFLCKMAVNTISKANKFWSSCSGGCEDHRLQGCDAVHSGRIWVAGFIS